MGQPDERGPQLFNKVIQGCGFPFCVGHVNLKPLEVSISNSRPAAVRWISVPLKALDLHDPRKKENHKFVIT